eukprot:gene19468-biopygen3625
MRGEKGSQGWWRSGKGKGKGGWFFPGDVPWREPIRRGEALLMWGYACDEVTHCVRSPDVPGRRFAIIVRIVRQGAPMHTSLHECMRPREAPAPAIAGAERAPLERRDDRRDRQRWGAPAASPPRGNRPRPPAGLPPAARPHPQPPPLPPPQQQQQQQQLPFPHKSWVHSHRWEDPHRNARSPCRATRDARPDPKVVTRRHAPARPPAMCDGRRARCARVRPHGIPTHA